MRILKYKLSKFNAQNAKKQVAKIDKTIYQYNLLIKGIEAGQSNNIYLYIDSDIAILKGGSIDQKLTIEKITSTN